MVDTEELAEIDRSSATDQSAGANNVQDGQIVDRKAVEMCYKNIKLLTNSSLFCKKKYL